MPKEKTTFHVGVIISLYNKKGQLLLAKRAPFKTHAANVWENISGAVEANEQPIETLNREIEEELGSSVKYEVKDIYHTFQTILQNGRNLIGICFLCEYLDGVIVLNQEHTAFKWVSINEAIELTETLGLKEEFKLLKENYPEIFLKHKL